MKLGCLASTRAGAWSLGRGKLPPSPLLSSPPSRSFLYPDQKSASLLLDNNNKIIYYLPGFCTAVSCGLAIDTPVSSEDHVYKDPAYLSLTPADTTGSRPDTGTIWYLVWYRCSGTGGSSRAKRCQTGTIPVSRRYSTRTMRPLPCRGSRASELWQSVNGEMGVPSLYRNQFLTQQC